MNSKVNGKNENKQIWKLRILIFIFSFSIILLLINWLILFDWADRKMEINGDLANNGNGYTIPYWLIHISYWQLIFIIVWSGLEIFIGDKYDLFALRYFAVMWAMTVLSLFAYSYYGFLKGNINRLINGVSGTGWESVPWIWYIVLDIFQLTCIHYVVPSVSLCWLIKYGMPGADRVKENRNNFFIWSYVFIVSLFVYSMIVTSMGVKAGYPLMDWPHDPFINGQTSTYGWPIWLQLTIDLLFIPTFYLSHYWIMEAYIRTQERERERERELRN